MVIVLSTGPALSHSRVRGFALMLALEVASGRGKGCTRVRLCDAIERLLNLLQAKTVGLSGATVADCGSRSVTSRSA